MINLFQPIGNHRAAEYYYNKTEDHSLYILSLNIYESSTENLMQFRPWLKYLLTIGLYILMGIT